MKRRIFISAGHSDVAGKDRGATGHDYHEGVLAANFRDKILACCKQAGTVVNSDARSNVLIDTMNLFKVYSASDSILIDIHFNASDNTTATGVVTLIPTEFTETELSIASHFSDIVSQILQIPKRSALRGVKGVETEESSARKKLGWMRLVGHNILIELCFISNKEDLMTFFKNEDKLAWAFADYIKALREGTKP